MPREKLTLEYATDLMKRQKRFTVRKKLGQGAFGTVFLSEDLIYGNEQIAIKFVDGGPEVNKYILREIENHRKLRHPHVIEFRRVIGLPGKLAIVMEYANGGNLFNYVKEKRRLDESLGRWFFQQLMVAVDYCHRKGVACRDIKLENILLVQGELLPILKLCDFGYSKHDIHSFARSPVGSTDYMAPEVFASNGYDAKLADAWSCGVVLYIMLAGKYPFQTPEIARLQPEERAQCIRQKIGSLDWPMPNHISPECQQLLRKILVHAKSRITIDKIMEEPWCQKNFPAEARTLNDHIMQMDKATMIQVEKAQSAAEIVGLISSVPSSIDHFDPVIEECLNEIQEHGVQHAFH